MGHHRRGRSRSLSGGSSTAGRKRRTNKRAKVARRHQVHVVEPPTASIALTDNTASTGRTPTGTIVPDSPVVKDKTSKAWENIVLHYLSKLKNVWRPAPVHTEHELVHPSVAGNRESSAAMFRRVHHGHRKRHILKMKSKQPPVTKKPINRTIRNGSVKSVKKVVRDPIISPTISPVASEYCLVGKQKAFNIVSNALEYGLANGIVSKNGNFFWLSHKLQKQAQEKARQEQDLTNNNNNCDVCQGADGIEAKSRQLIDGNAGHDLAINKSRAMVNRTKSVLPTENLKFKQVVVSPITAAKSTKSMRSVKSKKSRMVASVPKSQKSKVNVYKTRSELRNDYCEKKYEDADDNCKCNKCSDKYGYW